MNLYIWLTISSCYGSVSLATGLIGKDDGLSTLCPSCELACQQRVINTFPGPSYLRFEHGLVWISELLVSLYIWLTTSSCYNSIPLTLGLIDKACGLSNLSHSFEFFCQQRVLKTFLYPGYFYSKDWVLSVWYLLVNLYICITILSCYSSILLTLGLIKRDGFFHQSVSYLWGVSRGC